MPIKKLSDLFRRRRSDKNAADAKAPLDKAPSSDSADTDAVGCTGAAAVLLFLFSIFIPFERGLWSRMLARREDYFPQIDFTRLTAADVLRLFVQVLFLGLFTAVPVREFLEKNPLARFVRFLIRLAGRLGSRIGRLGSRLVFELGVSAVKSRRRVGREQAVRFQIGPLGRRHHRSRSCRDLHHSAL